MGVWGTMIDKFRPVRGELRQRGRAGERAAEHHLKQHGYRVLARNLRNRFGELDLIVRDNDGTIVVVEVKAGAANPAFPAELHVNRAKQRKIVALTAQLARKHGLGAARFRFDVVAVEFRLNDPPVVRHHVGAFESMV